MSVQAEPMPWSEFGPHFDYVLELDPAAREKWLAEVSTTQPGIANNVRALLKRLDALDAAGFLQGTPAAFVARAVVGPYRLIREIGYGGMSSIWLAERCDTGLKREVALKLPLTSPRMHFERFIRERDILAALTHPNIARLYDAGVSDSGQPYLAMEYVAGSTLIQSCDQRDLTIRERLRLFIQVLDAVQFAHARLIIHRDLKPSNVLVTAEGRVVLLDFGIGKLLNEGVPRDTPLTQMSGRALTPDYASPEQIAGQTLGTASDIYSLGVILYELLTGSRPYRLKRESAAALEEAILAEDVRRPSLCEIPVGVAMRRSTSCRGLARMLQGDLDTITLKALKKNPLDRYASVTAFAQDINNHLESLPVSARPDSAWYRVGRFASRHRISAAAAGIAVCALFGGASVAIWQARTAAAERDRAVTFASRNEAVTEFLGRVITEAAESPKPVTVGEMLTRSENMAQSDTSSSPENRAAVLEMIADRYIAVDEMERGTHLMADALALVRNSPDRALQSRITCKHAGAIADGAVSGDSIRTITRQLGLLAADSDTAAQCLLSLSRIYATEHHGENALRYAQRGLDTIRQSPHPSGTIEAALLGVVAFANHLNGRNAEADHYFAQAFQKYKDLGRERSDGALTVINDWAVALVSAGMPRPALQLIEEEERIEVQRAAGVEPAATIVGNHAHMLRFLGRFEAARTNYERECRLAAERGDDFSRVHCKMGLAALAVETRSWSEASRYLNEAVALLGPQVPKDSPPMLVRAVLQGRIDLAAGRLGEARMQFAQVLQSPDSGPTTVFAELGAAELELAAGNSAAAVGHARRALRSAVSLQGDASHSYLSGLASLMLGRALQGQGSQAEARTVLQSAVTHLFNTVDPDHPALVQARGLLAE